jgi:hypothetical protein
MYYQRSVPDAGAQDETVTCNKSEGYVTGETTSVVYWAEFPIDPGVTEVTTCHGGSPSYPFNAIPKCHRGKVQWKRGTSTGLVHCGTDPASFPTITVHR